MAQNDSNSEIKCAWCHKVLDDDWDRGRLCCQECWEEQDYMLMPDGYWVQVMFEILYYNTDLNRSTSGIIWRGGVEAADEVILEYSYSYSGSARVAIKNLIDRLILDLEQLAIHGID